MNLEHLVPLSYQIIFEKLESQKEKFLDHGVIGFAEKALVISMNPFEKINLENLFTNQKKY